MINNRTDCPLPFQGFLLYRGYAHGASVEVVFRLQAFEHWQANNAERPGRSGGDGGDSGPGRAGGGVMTPNEFLDLWDPAREAGAPERESQMEADLKALLEPVRSAEGWLVFMQRQDLLGLFGAKAKVKPGVIDENRQRLDYVLACLEALLKQEGGSNA